MDSNISISDGATVFAKLREHGVCEWCSYRCLFNAELNEAHLSEFISEYVEKNFSKKVNDSVGSKLKLKKSNTCVICLDVLNENLIEEVKLKVFNEVTAAEFDCDSYMLALSLPDACQLREHTVYLYLKSEFPQLYEKEKYFPRISLKEAWRFCICRSLSMLLEKTLDTKSEFIVQVSFSYEQDDFESRKINIWINENISRKARTNIRSAIELIGDSNFMKLYQFPVTVPNIGVNLNSVSIKRESIFVAGRYNKFSRKLSQTPWILSDGERKMENSVEEIISTKLIQIAHASSSRFSSSGREDIDVRMLGKGRPFAVELINAKISKISSTALAEVEKEINQIDSNSVFIRNLQIVDRSDMQILKLGEEQKTKTYCVICLIKRNFDVKDLLNLLPKTPFTIQQKTPLRVLHRRTVAVREKTIHEMSVHPVNKSVDGCTLIKIIVRTQAGTYVKEFVHGDFGRTVPSISYLLGKIPVDVLALDVMDIHVDWPRELEYDDSN